MSLVTGRTVTFGGQGVIVQGPIAFNGGGSTSASIDKRGTGTLVLTNASNLFSGVVTVSNGFLRVSNAGALGTSTAATAISTNSGTLEVRTDSTNVGSFSTKNISMTSNNGTIFVGSAVGGSGVSNLNQTVDFGGFVFASASRTLTLTGRNGFGFSAGVVGTNMGGNGTGNVGITTTTINGLTTIDGNPTIGDATAGRKFTFTTAGDAVFNGGVLTTGAGSGNIFSKAGTGTLTWNTALVGNASTITASLDFVAGTLEISNLANSIGAMAGITFNNTTVGAALNYTGVGESSSKTITLSATTGPAFIFANQSTATNPLIFSSFSGTLGAGTKFLVLGGRDTQANEISGII
ncbi:MAG: hypothetical protein EBR99_08510, partial [Actinobacteria bacterium]|nr:hypothetical protein [Actinomycetota bacterium]